MKKLAVVFFLFAFLTLNGFALEDSAPKRACDV